MRVIVDVDRCCGSGNCVLVAPEVFDQSADTGVVVLLQATPAAEQLSSVAEATALCPVEAIRLLRT